MRAERRKRLPNWAVGLILVVVVGVLSVYAFTKTLPWADKYSVQAVFANAGNVRPASPVRIAGVNVGKVTSVEHLAPEDAAQTAQVGGEDVPEERGAVDRDRRDDGARGVGAAAAHRRDDEAPPAPVPRGQPVRRPAARQPERPGGRRRARLPGRSDSGRRPARPGADHAPGGRADRPPDPARPVRQRARQARRLGGPARAVPLLARRLPVHVAGERGAARAAAPRPLGPDREPGLHGRGPGPQRGRAPGPRHEPADRARLVRGRERRRSSRESRSSPACCARASPPWPA